MQVQEAERSGTLVIEAKGVRFGYADRVVLRDLTTTIMRGDKFGIIGPNGSGKTTLLRLLLGDLPPQEGTIRHGTGLEVAYFDQLKTTLDEEKTVQQNVSDYDTIPINGQPRHVIGYLQDFLFPPERSRSLVKLLSGGERSRLLWPSCSPGRRMSWSWMSRPTTSTSRRWSCSRACWWNTSGRCSWSATTGRSSTMWPPAPW